MHRHFALPVAFAFNSANQNLDRDFAHFLERLANRGKARIVKCSPWNVVKANDRNVDWDVKSRLLKCANRTNGRDVVIGEKRGKGPFCGKQLFPIGISEIGRGVVRVDLHDKLRIQLDLHLPGYVLDCVPSVCGIGALGVAAKKGDPAVTQVGEVLKS